jgi:ComF family protein
MAAVEPTRARAGAVVTAALGVVRSVLRDLERFALPQRCRGCGVEIDADVVLCTECAATIPRLGLALCLRCLASGRAPDACTRHPAHRAWAPWIYDERAAAVVHALKFQGRPGLAAGLGGVIAGSVPPTYRPDLIVEVPLHPARRRERGYNQAARLAAALARELGCPWLEGALERVRATRPQTRLGPAARRTNLVGAFRVRAPEALARRSILIVDDVITTGSTLEACCDTLARIGARPSAVALAWAS